MNVGSDMWRQFLQYYGKVNDWIYRGFQRFFVPILAVVLVSLLYMGGDAVVPIAGYYRARVAMAENLTTQTVSADRSSAKLLGVRNSLSRTESVMSAPIMEDKIVLEGGITLEVGDTTAAKQQLEELTATYQGKILNYRSYYYRDNSSLAYDIAIKVPHTQLKEFADAVAAIGKKTAENMSMQDITLSYYDNANTLRNLILRRDRLRKLMDSDTKKLTDIIEVDRELSKVQTQIENLQRIQQRSDYNVSYSSFNVQLLPEVKIETNASKWSLQLLLKESINLLIALLQKALHYVMVLLVFLIVAVVVVLPAALLFGALLWLMLLILKKLYLSLKALVIKTPRQLK